ncbi:hypothetical protein LPJ70_004293 [Coemansia sp. RSA 2708]|nr:hypothetical protein LPJ70_004293 [Coemansia sp. RSA 2708]
MDVEYLGPTRYDYDTSDEEGAALPSTAPPVFVVRLQPTFQEPADTLVISLVPLAAADKQIGVVYSPAPPPKQLPFSGGLQTNNALARVFWANGMLQIAATEQPTELQFGWIQVVAGRLSPKRIVVVDTDTAMALNEFRSPAVLASKIVLGLPAAVLNYAEAYDIPCRHVRADGQTAMLDRETVDRLFASKQAEHAADQLAALRHDVSVSLYV